MYGRFGKVKTAVLGTASDDVMSAKAQVKLAWIFLI